MHNAMNLINSIISWLYILGFIAVVVVFAALWWIFKGSH